MAKQCGFCDYTSDDDAAFAEHMRTAHGWGASVPAAPVPTAAPAEAVAEEPGLAKFCGVCGAPRDAASTNFCRNCGAAFAAVETKAAPVRPPGCARSGCA